MIYIVGMFGLLVLAWRTRHPWLALALLCACVLCAAAGAQAGVAGPQAGPHAPGNGLRCLRIPGPFAVCADHNRDSGHHRRHGKRSKESRHHMHCRRLYFQYVAHHGRHTPQSLKHLHGCDKWEADAAWHRRVDGASALPAFAPFIIIMEEL